MTTEKAFREELSAMLLKYQADVEILDGLGSYPCSSSGNVVSVTLPTIRNEEDEIIQDFCQFELGDNFNGNDVLR